MKETIKLSAVLFIATSISALLITSLHNISVPILEARESEVLNSTFTAMYGSELDGYELRDENLTADAVAVYDVTLTDGTTNTVFEMVEQGKNGPIKMLIGYDADSNITQFKYLEINETPGIGSKVTEDGFINKIIGQNASDNEVDGIAGATISSTAVRTAVENSAELMLGGAYA